MKLSKSHVDKAAYEGSGKTQCIYWDDELKGFGLRIYPPSKRNPKGQKTFVLGYRINNRWRVTTLGKYGPLTVDAARRMAKEKLYKVIQGEDPAEEKSLIIHGSTMSTLAEEYLEKHAKVHKRTWDEDEKRINRVILPALGRRLLSSITRRDIVSIHEKVGQKAPYEANRILALLSVMFEFAIKMGYAPDAFSNPARGIKKYKEEKRDRWIKPDELPRLIDSIESESNVYIRAALWLYILTGVRKSELLQAKWDDIDFERAELRLPNTKAGRIHYVHLAKPALDLLEALPKELDNPYILPGKNGKHLVNIDKPWAKIREASGLKDVRLHDLRRTVGSWLASGGYSLHLIGKILNHSNASTTQIYARLSDDPIKKAMEDHAQKIVNIANMRSQKKAEGE